MADQKPLKHSSGATSQFGTGDTVPVANGGTGATTLTSNGVLLGNTTSAITATTAGTAGQVLVGTAGAPAFGTSFIGASIVVQKTGGETVTSSTALQNDDHLTFSIAANETWKGVITLPISANPSGGFKFDITAPSGASGSCAIFGGNSFTSGWVAIGTGFGASAVISNTTMAITFAVVNSSNAGSVTLRWAQNASFGTGTTIAGGATLTAIRTA